MSRKQLTKVFGKNRINKSGWVKSLMKKVLREVLLEKVSTYSTTKKPTFSPSLTFFGTFRLFLRTEVPVIHR